MKLPGLAPEFQGSGLQSGNRADGHAQEMLGFPRFFSAGVDAKKEFFSRNRVVRLAITSPDARSAADQLVNNTICHRALRNRLNKIYNFFAKASRPLLQIVNAGYSRRIFPKNGATLLPKRLFLTGYDRH